MSIKPRNAFALVKCNIVGCIFNYYVFWACFLLTKERFGHRVRKSYKYKDLLFSAPHKFYLLKGETRM
jgi:hypothetical protein